MRQNAVFRLYVSVKMKGMWATTLWNTTYEKLKYNINPGNLRYNIKEGLKKPEHFDTSVGILYMT